MERWQGGWERVAPDEEAALTAVRRAFGREPAPVEQWRLDADPVPFTNMTTAALARVRGTFADDEDAPGWSLFVKTVQSPSQSPLWSLIPPSLRTRTLDELPWRAEVDLYRSAVSGWLPPGIRLPVVHAIEELGSERTAIWMEDAADTAGRWDLERYRRAARALGRMAGRLPEGGIPTDLPVRRRDLRHYFSGRIAQGVLPGLSSDETWGHPLVTTSVDERLRADLTDLVATVPSILSRLDELPRTLAHGDACPQNLLADSSGEGLVMIDWAFVGVYAIGYDLAQLIAGRAETGELARSELAAVHSAIVPSYLEGLRDEGATVDAEAIELGYVGALTIRSAFTALPLEHLRDKVSPRLQRLFARRAAYGRYIVDLARSSLEDRHGT